MGSLVGTILVVAVCVSSAIFLIAREKHRRAMLAEESGDNAPCDRADSLWLPSHFGDQPNVSDLFHNGTHTR
jgi:hypothetical protein